MKNLTFLLLALIVSFLLITGCNQENAPDNPVSFQKQGNDVSAINDNSSLAKLSNVTRVELARVRSATAKYHSIDKAMEDGYADVNIYEPHMGWHYMKADFLDGTFDMVKPELLVYAPWPNGKLQLVAAEYAVPYSLSPDPPEGFTGDDDVWNYEPAYDLWTLHAWVWYYNPDGVFEPFNPRVD